MTEVTQILSLIEQGDPNAAEQLLPLVYDELRKMAAAKLANERPGQTLQATALVHEAYLRLVQDVDAEWDSRGHFFAAAATAMRRILVDNARRKASMRAGGGLQRRQIDASNEPAIESTGDDILALNEALEALSNQDQRKAALVELRCFGGLTNSKAAQCLGISTATAERDWAYARAWLHQRMTSEA